LAASICFLVRGIKKVAFTYNPGWLDYVKKRLGNGSKWGLKFTYVLQEKPLGLANIFQVCEKYINGDRFLLHLGDNIFTKGINEMVEYFEREKPDGMVGKIELYIYPRLKIFIILYLNN